MSLIDYSKALFHLENLKNTVERAEFNINSEDISIKFLFNCMEEKIKKEYKLSKEYNDIVSYYFDNKYHMREIKSNMNFSIFKTKEDLIKFVNNNQIDQFNYIDNMPVFLTDKNRLFIPENEINALEKPYIYLGRYMVLIKY